MTMADKTWLLLVDDSAAYSQMIQSMLQLEGQYGVDWASNLDQMRRKLAEKSYAALLLDNHLPDGTGLGALPGLVTKPEMPPIILITGEGDEKIASEAIKLGAYDYIRKGEPELIDLMHIVDRAIRMHAELQRKVEAEEKLRYHALLLDQLSDGIIVLNHDESISYWNEGAEDLFGLSAELTLGKNIRDVLPHSSAFHAYLDTHLTDEDSHVIEMRKADEQVVYVSINSAGVGFPENCPPGRVFVFRDITPYRLLQEELRSAQMRLMESARVASVAELASSMAHHIHNPLTTVLGEAQILARSIEPDSPAYQSACAIEEAGWRASKVIKNLMDITTEIDTERNCYDLTPTILGAVELSRSSLEQNHIKLSLGLASGLPQVCIREWDLIDLWFHLIQMAVECASGTLQPWISVDAYLRDNDIAVKIRCSGIFPEEKEVKKAGDPAGWSGFAVVESICRKYERALSVGRDLVEENAIVIQFNIGKAQKN